MSLYYCDFQLPVLEYIFGATIWLGKRKSKRARERARERETEAAIYRKRGSLLGNIYIEIQSF
jgi:hypothetical protein